MGKQTSLIKFTGRVRDLIGYEREGEHYIRSAPLHVHRSARTKLSALAFGKASRLGAAMRQAMRGELKGMAGGSNVNRLNKALFSVLQADDLHRIRRFAPANFKSLKGFGLNPHADVQKVLSVKPEVQRDVAGNIHVTLPPMENLTCNPRATHLSIRAVAVHVQPGFDKASTTASRTLLIPADRPCPGQTLVIPAAGAAVSCVLLEVVCCQEEHGRMYRLQNRLFTAVEVIAVLGGRMRRNRRGKVQRRQRLRNAHGRRPVAQQQAVGFDQLE